MPAAPFVLWCLLMPPRAPMAYGLLAPLTVYQVAYCTDTHDECEQQKELERTICRNPGAPCILDLSQCLRSDDPRLHIDRRQRTEIAHIVTTAFLGKVVHMSSADRHAELQKYGITEQEYEDAIGMSEGDAEQQLGRTLELPSKNP
ncbi:MAG TPA: hypothetical protein VMH37_19020 [Candidatus Binataceae bacterium]|nr:hypothetical protein [Candidatus Binataceae bacterium]